MEKERIAQEKAQKMSEVAEQNAAIEEERKNDFLRRQAEANQRLINRDMKEQEALVIKQ